ncbi:helix-turn-helix transcriptional regulator [Nakamurella sp. GG22]
MIQSSPGITAERLADRLGISERAARRYIGILREAGIPVESVRGRYGGYRLGRGVRLPPLMFSAAEALGLVMAVLDGHHDAADPTGPVGGALGKIVRALPESVAAQVEAVRRTTSPAPDRAAARPDPGITTGLVQACASRRPVRLDYRSEAGSEWTAEVDPWAVVVRHGRWYLLCRSRTADARRAYRIDRVRSVEMLDGTVTPPPDLEPVTMLEEHLAVGWEYEAEVIIEAPFHQVQPRLPRSLGRAEPAGGSATRLVGSTSNPIWYAEQLAVIPVPYRIVSCAEIRAAAAALGQRALAAAQADPVDPAALPAAGSRPAGRAGPRPDVPAPAAPTRPAV